MKRNEKRSMLRTMSVLISSLLSGNKGRGLCNMYKKSCKMAVSGL